jgi:hypothetical protein
LALYAVEVFIDGDGDDVLTSLFVCPPVDTLLINGSELEGNDVSVDQ